MWTGRWGKVDDARAGVDAAVAAVAAVMAVWPSVLTFPAVFNAAPLLLLLLVVVVGAVLVVPVPVSVRLSAPLLLPPAAPSPTMSRSMSKHC